MHKVMQQSLTYKNQQHTILHRAESFTVKVKDSARFHKRVFTCGEASVAINALFFTKTIPLFISCSDVITSDILSSS